MAPGFLIRLCLVEPDKKSPHKHASEMLLEIKEQLYLKFFFRRPSSDQRMPWRYKIKFQLYKNIICEYRYWIWADPISKWLRVSFAIVSWFSTWWLWLDWLCCICKKIPVHFILEDYWRLQKNRHHYWLCTFFMCLARVRQESGGQRSDPLFHTVPPKPQRYVHCFCVTFL